ncbi:MAG: hypothetical protein HFE86_04785 [Clostridiales bacterium]|nr:hypothetical protein [Clostridiales bacterium]
MPLLDNKAGLRPAGRCFIRCAGCGGPSEVEVYCVSGRPRLLGLPVAKIRRRYLGVCAGCGRRYRVNPVKGAALAAGRPVTILQTDLTDWPGTGGNRS